ncbi:MAG: AraC family transcriptional regulator [Lachnospiraceae bacterium]|nr:AraC family transcriptional regulator [Lachnospiraceae bacterium]
MSTIYVASFDDDEYQAIISSLPYDKLKETARVVRIESFSDFSGRLAQLDHFSASATLVKDGGCVMYGSGYHGRSAEPKAEKTLRADETSEACERYAAEEQIPDAHEKGSAEGLIGDACEESTALCLSLHEENEAETKNGASVESVATADKALPETERTVIQEASEAVRQRRGEAESESYYGRVAMDGNRAVSFIRDVIDWNYTSGESAKEYADLVHLSQTYICRMFRKKNGKSIGRWILERRMEKACDLLVNTDLMVRDVAERVGYTNFSYFCKRFKDFHHMTPNDYRKKYGKNTD